MHQVDHGVENRVNPLYQIDQFLEFLGSSPSSQSTSQSGLLVPLVAIEAAFLEKASLRRNGIDIDAKTSGIFL